jgi:hypothetical protein
MLKRYAALAAAAFALLAPAASAQSPEGWSGYVSIDASENFTGPQGSADVSHQAVWTFDGTAESSFVSDEFATWRQTAKFTATYSAVRETFNVCEGGSSAVQTTNHIAPQEPGSMVFDLVIGPQPADSQAKNYRIDPFAGRSDFLVRFVNTCPGNPDYPFIGTRLESACRPILTEAGNTPTTPDGPAATRLEDSYTVAPQGALCATSYLTATVKWQLTLGRAPECSDGIDNDSDGRIDYAAGGPLGDPGCTSDTDNDESNGTIFVSKNTLPDNDPASFGFTGPNGRFTLTDQSAPQRIDVSPGSHQVTEDPLALGWTLSEISCDDPQTTTNLVARNATVLVSDGETVRCTFTNRKGDADAELFVSGVYAYSGALAVGSATASGFDEVRVTGTPTGLAWIQQVCVRETWTATLKVSFAASTAMFWNGVSRPGPPEVTIVPIDKPGLFNRKYGERLTWEACSFSTEARYGPWPGQNILTVTGEGPFVSLEHKLTVWAVLDDGRQCSLKVGGSSATRAAFDWTPTPESKRCRV